jgi:hypothetical protein
MGCASITSVDIGSATIIGGDAFTGCSKLASVTGTGTLAGVNAIHYYAFRYCTSLTSITFGG